MSTRFARLVEAGRRSGEEYQLLLYPGRYRCQQLARPVPLVNSRNLDSDLPHRYCHRTVDVGICMWQSQKSEVATNVLGRLSTGVLCSSAEREFTV